MKHGAPEPVPLEALTADDPELYLAAADMDAWAEAHPCGCDALCDCDATL